MIMVDTCFLIDYQREAKHQKAGKVIDFLRQHSSERLQISLIAWGEFIAGFIDEEHPFIQFTLDRIDVLEPDMNVAVVYRKLFRQLKASGQLIGANDLWIASHAIARNQPLVTRNMTDFQRVADLRLLTY